ncbi:hypothetical protein VTH82DRAFT_323 [Thermothelomyces myriococcoides]
MEQLLMTEDKLDGGKLRELIDDKILGKEHFDWMAIEDKSKASGIAKFLVSLQIFCSYFDPNLVYNPVIFFSGGQQPLDVTVPVFLPIGPDSQPDEFHNVVLET